MSARYFCNRCLEESAVATRWHVLVVPSLFRYHELFQPLVIADAALVPACPGDDHLPPSDPWQPGRVQDSERTTVYCRSMRLTAV